MKSQETTQTPGFWSTFGGMTIRPWRTLERGWVTGLLGGLLAIGVYALPVALLIR